MSENLFDSESVEERPIAAARVAQGKPVESDTDDSFDESTVDMKNQRFKPRNPVKNSSTVTKKKNVPKIRLKTPKGRNASSKTNQLDAKKVRKNVTKIGLPFVRWL